MSGKILRSFNELYCSGSVLLKRLMFRILLADFAKQYSNFFFKELLLSTSYGPNFFLLKNLEINLMSNKLLKFFKDDLINL